jgi:Uma2 family endonuclease
MGNFDVIDTGRLTVLQQDYEIHSEDGRAVSEEEYWETYYEHPDFNYEWNNGFLEEVPVSDYINIEMHVWFEQLLNLYFQTYPIGKIVKLEFGFRLALPDHIAIRKPDLAVVLNNNLIRLDHEDRTFYGTYDLCVELISDLTAKAIKRDTVAKKGEYEAIGVREYYILDASNEHMVFYRLNEKNVYDPILPYKDDIIRSGILPGFQFRFSHLFTRPSVKELAENPVYQEYILPFYTETKLRAENAEKQAEQERLRAQQAEEQAKQERLRAQQAEEQANRLAARLKSLGISID